MYTLHNDMYYGSSMINCYYGISMAETNWWRVFGHFQRLATARSCDDDDNLATDTDSVYSYW